MNFTKPSIDLNSFTCPHCNSYSQVRWYCTDFYLNQVGSRLAQVRSAQCTHCDNFSIWVLDKMVSPNTGAAPFPNREMSSEVKKLYLEAASIHSQSPRAAAALLRLAIQVLCAELGESGKNINSDIGSLVKKGLPEIVQKSLDVVRVTGNDAVHPGQIDTDNPQTVAYLFDLVNIIIEYQVALPKQVSGIYTSLPKDKLKGIKDRDK